MRHVLMICLMLLAQRAAAQTHLQMQAAAEASFARMPDLSVVDRIAGRCGADDAVNAQVAYCTSENTIFLASDALELPQSAYLVGHVYGHAVQVQHGVADLALQSIRARPEDEAALRGWVERQVDCIAGYLIARAGLPLPDLAALFSVDPFDQPHWGRNPLARGPHVNLSVADRTLWLQTGYRDGIAACAVGDFGADLLVRAARD